MQPGYADIANELCLLAEDFGGNFRLGRYGQISGAGCYNWNCGCRKLRFVLLKYNRPGLLFVSCFREPAGFSQSIENMLFGSCGEYIAACFGKSGKNFNYLLIGFAGTENNLRKAAPDLTVMVETGKIKVLERQMTQFFDSPVNIKFAGFDLF